MLADMKRLLIPIAFLLTLPLSAATSRYLVLLRTPIHGAHLPGIDAVAEGGAHNIRTFQTIDAFAADLTDDEVLALRRSSQTRIVEPIKLRHINDAPSNA